MRKILMVVCGIGACSLLFTGCIPPQREEPFTQLQVREIQTREFDTSNSKLVMKSMMNVLQDESFIIKNAVLELGLLSAEKNIDVENNAHVFLAALGGDANARWSKYQILEASANVSEFGSKTKVRLNFQTKTMDNFGCPKNVVTIRDPIYYQSFFDKVSKGIFLQEQDI